jgi:hypothetical protein
MGNFWEELACPTLCKKPTFEDKDVKMKDVTEEKPQPLEVRP